MTDEEANGDTDKIQHEKDKIQTKTAKHDSGVADLEKVTDYAKEKDISCQDISGAVLASPTEMCVNIAMRNMMKTERETWTGIHATFSKGDYFSVEGVPLRRMSVQWMQNEPDNKNNDEDCIILSSNGTIADVNCKELHPYLCFKERTNVMVFNNKCGTFDNEYNWESRTGSCYKFHRVPRNWTRAFMTCAAEGGYLAIINSETEAKVLKELFAKNPSNSIRAAIPGIMREIAHIGFHDWDERHAWTTIQGTSLAEAGYDVFSEGQPDNGPPPLPGEYCGGMFRNGKLDDIWCHESGPFICEKGPDSLLSDKEL